MRYVVKLPDGSTMQGVKEMSPGEAIFAREYGLTLIPYQGDNRLSLAASTIWRMRSADPDPMGDPSGDAGAAIAAYHRRSELKAIEEFYPSPGAYNAELKERVSRSWYWLAIEDVCECGTALDVTVRYTRQYGGGWDTSYRCPICGFGEVCV